MLRFSFLILLVAALATAALTRPTGRNSHRSSSSSSDRSSSSDDDDDSSARSGPSVDVTCSPVTCQDVKCGDCTSRGDSCCNRCTPVGNDATQPLNGGGLVGFCNNIETCNDRCSDPVLVPLTADFANNVNVTQVGTTKVHVNNGIGGAATIMLITRFTNPTQVFPVTGLPPNTYLRFTQANGAVTVTIGRPIATSESSFIQFLTTNSTHEGRLVVLLENTAGARFVTSSGFTRTLMSYIDFSALGPPVPPFVKIGFGIADDAFNLGNVSFAQHLRFFGGLGETDFMNPANFKAPGAAILIGSMHWHTFCEPAPLSSDNDDDGFASLLDIVQAAQNGGGMAAKRWRHND